MEKTISIRSTEITFSVWDLGGQREFINMLPLVCNDAVCILFMFDLSRKQTLNRYVYMLYMHVCACVYLFVCMYV